MEILGYPFFIRAVCAGVLAGVTCGIVGSYIVSRRIVFISGGITHASFGGIGLGYFFGFSPVAGAGAMAVLSSVAVRFFSRGGEVREDSLIGILWSFGMALGIIFVYLTPGYAPDLMSYLFGSILTVSAGELYLMAAVMILVAVFFALFYNLIMAVSFDEDFAASQSLPVSFINYSLMILIALTIMIGIKVAGVILVISLLTIPQAAAGLLADDMKKMILWSVLFAVISFIGGLFGSYYMDIPSGATIIFFSVILFLILRVYVYFRGKLRLRKNIA